MKELEQDLSDRTNEVLKLRQENEQLKSEAREQAADKAEQLNESEKAALEAAHEEEIKRQVLEPYLEDIRQAEQVQ